MTYLEAYRQGEALLREAGIEEYDTDAMLLLLHVSGMDRTRYLLDRGSRMPETAAGAYRQALARRCRHEPLQHIMGGTFFCGLWFKVSGEVLVPRQDTEVLVREAEALIRRKDERVLDLCTGSGCIIVSLKKDLPEIMAYAADLSPSALALAAGNAAANGCGVTFYEGDLFGALPAGARYDLIVSNPPYIPAAEIQTLSPEVRLHDPRMALDGGGDGLDFYRRIAKEAPRYLLPGGRTALEIGAEQAASVSTLLADAGFTDIRCVKDLAGRDRVITARLAD